MSFSSTLIIEDQPSCYQLLRDVLAAVLPNTRTSRVADLKQLANIDASQFALVLLDIQLPDGQSLDWLKQFKHQHPNIPTIVTTLYASDDIVYAALQAGADGYLLKSDGTPKLIASLENMLQGQPPISPAIARKVLHYFRNPQPIPFASSSFDQASSLTESTRFRLNTLSTKENAVLTAIAAGATVKQVANDMHLSPHTINDRLKSIYRKLGINSRAEAAQIAAKAGLI